MHLHLGLLGFAAYRDHDVGIGHAVAVHAWQVFGRDHCGIAMTSLPWAVGDNVPFTPMRNRLDEAGTG